MEIKFSLSVSHSYSSFPSLLLFTGFPSKRLSDLYCSDSREPRDPHALGRVQLLKNTKGTRLMTMVPSSTPFHIKCGKGRTCFLRGETQSPLSTNSPPYPHLAVTPILLPRTCQSSHDILEIEVPCSVALASLYQVLHGLSIV